MHLLLAFAVLAIDHVTIAGPYLDAMTKAFAEATSITPEYGGKHANQATEMALVAFPDGSYLELMAIQPDADPRAILDHVWSKFLINSPGPCAFAIRGLPTADMEVKDPVPSGRTRPDGVQLRWETSDIGNALRGTFFPFLIQDLTPREIRVYPSGKPTTDKFSGVSKVVVAVVNLEESIAKYRQMFHLPQPILQHDDQAKAEIAWFEGTPFVLTQGMTRDSWVSQRVKKFGAGPCAIVLGAVSPVAHPVIGPGATSWFGKKIYWTNLDKLGWRLGAEN